MIALDKTGVIGFFDVAVRAMLFVDQTSEEMKERIDKIVEEEK